jgi:hypothetical protein
MTSGDSTGKVQGLAQSLSKRVPLTKEPRPRLAIVLAFAPPSCGVHWFGQPRSSECGTVDQLTAIPSFESPLRCTAETVIEVALANDQAYRE